MSDSRIAVTIATTPKEKFYETMTCTFIELEYLVEKVQKVQVVAMKLSRGTRSQEAPPTEP